MTGLRDFHVRVLASMKVVALTGISSREHPFLYEMSGSPCKMFFLRWILPSMVWRICVIVTEQSHVFECRWSLVVCFDLKGLSWVMRSAY